MFTKEGLEETYKFPFGDDAVRVLEGATQEAVDFNHHYVGTEHFLLGYLRLADSDFFRKRLGVTIQGARGNMEVIIGRGDLSVLSVIDRPGLTPRSVKAVKFGVDEARRLRNPVLEADHIMLGLVREGEGIAVGVLESLGVSLSRARDVILEKRQALHPIDRLRLFLADPNADPYRKQLLTTLLEVVAETYVPVKRDQNPPTQ